MTSELLMKTSNCLSQVGNWSFFALIDEMIATAVGPTYHLDSNGELRRFGGKKLQEVGIEHLF